MRGTARPQGVLCGLWIFGLLGGLLACGAESELFPDGPPMITQVRFGETVTVAGVGKPRTVFGFGSHPLASREDAHAVTTATASGNALRVVVDELLAGEALEELRCRWPVDDDVFARLPSGTTADDVARCAVPDAGLAASCPGTGAHDVCVCTLDGGCPSDHGGARVIPRGASVGVLDLDQDGAADAARLIAGTAAMRCGTVDVAIDLDASFWTPAGTQQKPASGGFDALGPALVVVPAGALPTGATCGVTFGANVVDPSGARLCAPAAGDRAAGCTPGDTSAIGFTVEPLALAPAAALLATGQSRTAAIGVVANAPLAPTTMDRVTVLQAGAPFAGFTARLVKPDEIDLTWTVELAAQTRYTVRVDEPRDTYGGAGPAFELTFTTAE